MLLPLAPSDVPCRANLMLLGFLTLCGGDGHDIDVMIVKTNGNSRDCV